MPYGPERKNRVGESVASLHPHTVLALPRLGLVAYASLGLRQGFANPVHTSPVEVCAKDIRYI
jgi:hypothetical protein